MAPKDARKTINEIRKKKATNRPNHSNNNNSNHNNNNNNNKTTNVKDLRQLIAKKAKPRGSDRNSAPAGTSRTVRNNPGTRDLRDVNKKLAARKSLPDRSRDAGGSWSGTLRSALGIKSHDTPPGKRAQQPYVAPHQQPTVIIAQPSIPHSNLAMDNEGASVLVSNLSPTITQSDIIQLFGDVGVLTNVNMINQTTALVTYQNSSDAVIAIKVYHNRLLDGKAMFVNMMPSTASSGTSIRSRIGHPAPMEISYARR